MSTNSVGSGAAIAGTEGDPSAPKAPLLFDKKLKRKIADRLKADLNAGK